jgi:hypothetical protein
VWAITTSKDTFIRFQVRGCAPEGMLEFWNPGIKGLKYFEKTGKKVDKKK